ncbi:tryptophan--tRNA ligase [Firmicutes bacterium CAG:313]|nr:tryptophan--tRNA ligase [Firmicutes bacterium CAG:313]
MKTLVSGIQPSGRLTLGNYLGAIKNFVALQDEGEFEEFFVFIADLHAITVPKDPTMLRQSIKKLAALYLACGLNPEKITLFIQSEVHEHAEIGYLLQTITYIGELERMTQYKDKKAKQVEGVSSALLTYPVLMAGDILLYNANGVPVGQDQKQHLELTRTLAERFNSKYSETFNIPDALIVKEGAKIMSLQDPSKKMSKSDPLEKASIYLDDSEAIIRKKIASAVTDSDGIIKYDEVNKPGISNLLNILSCCTNKSISDLETEFEGVGYGEFKKAVADAIITLLMPIQEKYEKILADKDYLNKVLDDGAQKASYFARKTLSKVKRKMGVGR